MNYKIRKLEDEIIEVLNASDAPMEAKRLVVQNVLSLIKEKADAAIIEELKEVKEDGIQQDNMDE